MDPSKVILTDKGRIRFNACAVLDVVQFEAQRPLEELQQEDFIHFGKLILSLGTSNLNLSSNVVLKNALDTLGRNYSSELRDTVAWLLTPTQEGASKKIDDFLSGIAGHVISSYDSTLHAIDTQTSELARELEGGRLVRLMLKLGLINERPEYEGDRNWSENGERYMLKLFRDFVFHPVDENGRPVVDPGRMISCLNKLDAGSEEKILLTSRDSQNVFLVSYKELKKQAAAAFQDLTKPPKGRY
jgi:PAB-dependent poly(A)-specific ribonuclease subunit 3